VKPRPFAPLSLDLDNKWSYLKTHGDGSWRDWPSYFDVVVPRILSLLAERNLTITFFVVGTDAESPAHREHLQAITAAGHDIGSHSHLHEPWLHLYDRAALRSDLSRAHAAIAEATGREPGGFRGPGFSLSGAVLEELAGMGYAYDATVFPNVLNPVSRAYFLKRSNLTPEERRQREALFGTLRDATRPNVPFAWRLDGERLLEVPVTTMPGVRVPFHFSYLTYLAGRSEKAARAYFGAALALCRAGAVAPSLLLHPLDFLGVEDEPDLGFFPGMQMSGAAKLELTAGFIDQLAESYRIVPLSDYVRTINPRKSRHPASVN
jgi:peptidoglycan/xylan/chitin deacetylase (PgdA/CDA1 family)